MNVGLYWERFWLRTVKPERLSVFKSSLRTNNDCESYNHKLRKRLGTRPGFWAFITGLKKQIDADVLDFDKISQDVPIRRQRPRAASQTDKRLETLSQKLECGRISPIQFIHAVSKQYKSRFSIPDEGDFETSDESEVLEESEVSEESEVLENDNRNCPICYLNTIDSLIYPCGHTFCTPCGQVLKEMGQHCHSCRGIIVDIVRIH